MPCLSCSQGNADVKKVEEAVKKSGDMLAEMQNDVARLKRSNDLGDLSSAATKEMKRIKDKDPKIASRHRAFLEGVKVASKHFSSNSFKEKSLEKWTTAECIKQALEHGYDAAKLGAGDEALAKSWRDPLLATANAFYVKFNQETAEKDKRARARANWK